MDVSTLVTVPDVEHQLGHSDFALLEACLRQLMVKQRRNRVRADYYDMHNMFRDLRIALPPNLRELEVASGWNAKAVDQRARRIRKEGFVLPGGLVEDWGIPEIERDNRAEVEFPAAVVSTLIHPPSFISTTVGDVEAGEPAVLITYTDANQATGIWHPIKRGLAAFVHVMQTDEGGVPLRMVFVTPEHAYGLRRDKTSDPWDVRKVAHSLRRVPVEPLTVRARLGRPFGSSVINRAMMSIVDSAMRTMARSEVGAEFFSSPQRWIMGADEDSFQDQNGNNVNRWTLIMGRLLAMERDDDGNLPEVGQFPQISMQPHVDHFRMWATAFAGEASLPVSSLGVVQDNPSSAEAIYAAKEELVMDVEDTTRGFDPALVRSMWTAVQLRDQLPEIPRELRALGVRWRDPSTPSRAAATDAVMKQVAAGVLPPDSEVALEALGYDQTTIGRVLADRRRSRVAERSAALRTQAQGAMQDPVVAELAGTSGEPV